MSDYAVVNPATGETVKEYPTISDSELDSAIGTAEDAFRDWSQNSSVAERAAIIRRVGELHVERREELADIIIREMGKPSEIIPKYQSAVHEEHDDASRFLIEA